jgi:hypothetical protein
MVFSWVYPTRLAFLTVYDLFVSAYTLNIGGEVLHAGLQAKALGQMCSD